LKALIIDDEEPARQELRYLLEQMNEIEIVGEGENAKDALKLLAAIDCSVVFLDIQMPGMSGIELGEVLKSLKKPPAIIFVTAYEEYALQAFEVDAVDYILKPFDSSRIEQAIKKVLSMQRSEGEENKAEEQTVRTVAALERIPLEYKGRTLLLAQDDIAYIYTQNEAVYVRTIDDKEYLARFTLKDLEQRLSSEKFFRTHRCYIVNLSRIKEITPYFSGTYTVTLDNKQKTEIPVSRNQARKLKKILGL